MKKFAIPIVMVFVGILCLIVFQIAGSQVDAYGILREPFAFLPIGYALIKIGLLWTMIVFFCT